MAPTERQMREAGIRLGILAEGDPIRPSMRTKLAKVVDQAMVEDRKVEQVEAKSGQVATPIISIHQALVDGGIPVDNVGRIVAALAPQIWRDQNPGAAQK